MTNDCPKCGNDLKVYDHGNDPVVGAFVLCREHGIQLAEKVEHKTKEK